MRSTRPGARGAALRPSRYPRRLLALGRGLYPPCTEPEGGPYLPRPATRGECLCMERPCPYVSCRYHLYLDVNPTTGSLKLNFPDLEVWELRETCALDVAERDGVALEEVGRLMNLTRERVRQIELRAESDCQDCLAAMEDAP